MYKEKESGRSMVEMLGVLAIIGVLSVGGIAGYTTAMNKHRANQILNGASVRAIVISTQIQRGSAAPTLGEFTDNEVGGAKFGTKVQNTAGTGDWNKDTDKRFSLTLENVPAEVCAQMKAMKGKNGIIRKIDDGCTTITYNNDLSPNDPAPSGPTCPAGTSEDGAGGFAKNVDTIQCYCNGESEKWSGSACDGTLSNDKCTDNTDCKKGRYCNYYDAGFTTLRSGSCENGPDAGSGLCAVIDKDAGTNDYGFTLSADAMDWFSAEKFCEALNKTMVSLEDTDCTTSSCDWSKTATGNLSRTFWWTRNLVEENNSNSCSAYIVFGAKDPVYRTPSRDKPNKALCR